VPPERDLSPAPWETAAELYGPATLFHGAHFQVLKSVDGISATHARATLVSPRETGWDGAWLCEPAALDGALQLAVLFGIHRGPGMTLPMRIDRVVYRPEREPGLFHCDFVERRRTHEGLLCDLSLSSTSGTRVIDLLGVELFVLPNGTTAS
jgi:hypothetical protein